MSARLGIDHDRLVALCRQHHVRQLALFGSVLRDDFGPGSDVDVLVEFEPGQVPGFIALHGLEEELRQLMDGHPVDLVTIGALNHRIRDRVLASAEVQFAA
jgi:uncharacterized protein